MASVLIVGGAGYVGSAVVAHLSARGEDVWVLDDLSTGHRAHVPDEVIRAGKFIESRAGDRATLDALFARQRFDVAFHFAAKSIVGESVKFPEIYWENNVDQTRIFLDAYLAAGMNRFVFSSTAAVYGDPAGGEVDELAPTKPINPYGETKLAVERMLEDYAGRFGLRSIALRYFNAAGAHRGERSEAPPRIGEDHAPETHLIPNVLAAALEGRSVSIFGEDYPTRDGTCIRDYVHVTDLADAHAAAAARMMGEGVSYSGRFEAFNLGSAAGFTVKEVIAEAERAFGGKIATRIEARRPGDPAKLVAVSDLARRELGFRPRGDALASILSSALEWERTRLASKRAIFLDRDGTLNVDPGYLSDAEKLELLPGVPAALKRLADAGYLLVVVSNQSGIARGKVTRSQLSRIHERMDRALADHGVRIFHYALCFHHPDEDCACRKPRPKLVVDAAARYRIDLTRSYMVGDKLTDVACGRAAGLAGSFLVGTGYGASEVNALDDATVFAPDLGALADRILDSSR